METRGDGGGILNEQRDFMAKLENGFCHGACQRWKFMQHTTPLFAKFHLS